MRGHLDPQTIAEVAEGLLPARRAARARAHLAACLRCSAIEGQLASVTAVLARSATPPMPTAVAVRLDAALAAETAARAAGTAAQAAASPGAASPRAASDGAAPAGLDGGRHPGHAGPGHAGPGHAGPLRWRPGRRAGQRAHRAGGSGRPGLRAAAALAAVVLLGGGGYLAVRLATGTSGVTASSAGSAGSAPSRLSVPGVAAPAAPVPAAGHEKASAGSLPVIASGTDYRPGTLRSQVAAVLRGHQALNASQATAQPAGSAPAMQAASSFPQLAGCVRRLAGTQQLRLVDVARYDGQPAVVIVASVTGMAKVRVWVVGTGCSAQGGGVIAQLAMPAAG